MAITPEQYQMTQAELSGGAGGQQAYSKRIADLRAGVTNAPTATTTPTAPVAPKPVTPTAPKPTAPVTPQVPQAPTPVASATPAPAYRIQSGDTLSAIASRQGTTVAELMAANPNIKDPNRIFAGQSLNLPGTGITPPPAPGTPPVAPTAPTTPTTPTTPTDGTPTIPTPEEIAGMSEEQKIQIVKDLAAQGIPFEMVQAYLESQTPTVDPNKYWEEAQAKYGLDDLENKINTNPTQTFEEIVTSVYDKLNLSALNADITGVRDKIAKAEADRDEAMETVNENPWLTEASRVGRVSRINDKAQNELNRLQNQLTLSETLYARGQDESKDVATRALAEFDKQRSYDIETLNRLSERAVSEAQAKFEMAQGEATKESYRYFPQYAEALPTETDTTGGKLQQLADGTYAWFYPDGRVLKTGQSGSAPVNENDLTFKQKVDLELKIGKVFQDSAKDALAAGRQINLMNVALGQADVNLNAASQGVLVVFQKMLDPSSVVRESEYARSSAGVGAIDRIKGFVTKIGQGGAGLTKESLTEIVAVANKLQEEYKKEQLKAAKLAQTQADNYGLNLENVLPADIKDMLGSANDDPLGVLGDGGGDNPLDLDL